MRRYKGKCDIFLGIEHRLVKVEMEEQFNKEALEGWRFAADASRITMKQHAARIVSTHQDEFLWQSTATWEQLERGRRSD